MCGRYYVDDETAKAVARLIGQINEKSSVSRDVHPTDSATIITGYVDNYVDKLAEKQMYWGFPSFQGKGVLFNARCETVLEKRMFKESAIRQRCVIPAKGFYEWDKQKNKVTFLRKDEPLLWMAGIYNRFEGVDRFVILTTKANASVSPVHDRMPLIIESNELENWIFDEKSLVYLLNKDPVLLERYMPYEQQSLLFDTEE